MCCGNCCCFRWSKTMSIVGMALSVIEFILAAVYNFHTFGFCLAIVGMLASAVFFFLIRKEETTKMSKENKESVNSNEEADYQPVPSIE
jgi:dipeptide/tripeptide permease